MRPDLAIVTGSSRGIGSAVVDALLERGFEVVGVARGVPGVPPNARYRHFRCDLSDLAAVQQLFEHELPAAVRLAGRARIGLVNNAARLDVAPVTQLAPEDLLATLCVNLAVPIFLHGWLLRRTARDTRLRIVDLSSGAATSPYAGWVSYCATKAALDMAGQVVATEVEQVAELAGRDVALVSYAPGVVATAMQESLRRASVERFPQRERFVRMHEEGALVDPACPAAEIAEMLLDDELPRFSRRRFVP